MLQQDQPEEFVIATGKSARLEGFVSLVFREFDLDWNKYVDISEDFFRPSDITESRANPEKAQKILGWQAKYYIQDIVKFLVNEELVVD